MDDKTLSNCKLLIENRDVFKKTFPFDMAVIHLACGGIYTMKGLKAEPDRIRESKRIIKDNTGVMNYFRSYGFSCIAAMISTTDDPETTLKNGLQVYSLLKEKFYSSEYLPFAAMSIAQMAKPEDFEKIAQRTRTLYERMKAEHWFLTGSDDSGLCALMALSEKSDDELIGNAAICYEALKPGFFSGDAVQSLSHVLALSDLDPKEACQRTVELFFKLKEAGHKYGTYYELPTLGVLAMTVGDFDSIIPDMLEVDKWLTKQKGFGLISTVTKKQRLMYAGMMVEKDAVDDGKESLQSAAVNSMISMMIAQEVALYSAVCASSMIAASSASSAR